MDTYQTESHKIGLATPNGEEEIALCDDLDNAIHGDIPRDNLPNHGIYATGKSEQEACIRFREYLTSDFATYISRL